MRKRLKIISLFLFALLLSYSFIFVQPASADSDHIIHVYIYHDYYVPYMPGADNCYGVYRIVGSRGYQEISEVSVSRYVQAGKLPGSEDTTVPNGTDYVGQYHDARTLYRDDVFLFTSFQITAGPFEEIIWSGNYVYHHIKTYYFEAPYSVAGYMADFSPITGSSAYNETGRPWLIAADLSVIKQYMPDFEPVMVTPNFPGASALAGVSYADWKLLSSGKVTSNDWGYISKVTDSSDSNSRGYSRRSGRRYSYILTTNPANDSIKDIVGWWSPWAYEMLATVDDIRENGEIDEQQPYDELKLELTDEDRQAGITSIPQALINALKWDRPTIYYDESTINAYIYGAPQSGSVPSLGSTSHVWRYRMSPTLKGTEAIYREVSDKIIDAAKEGKSVPMPWTAGTGALDTLQGSTPGYWHVPKAGSLENKSMSIISFDPEFLGQTPFHRAQSNLYSYGDRNAPTLAGISDSYKSMSSFLGTSVGEKTNFLPAFNNKILRSPFKYGSLNIQSKNGYKYSSAVWNDPYMPGDSDTSSIWYWWSRNYSPFYKYIAPLSAVHSGMTLFDADDTTGWDRGIQRVRLPQMVHTDVSDINTTKTYSTSTQSSIKSRNISDIGSYTDYSGKAQQNKVNYVSEYKKAKPVDYGSVTLKGFNNTTVLSPMSVRYYPADINSLSSIRKAFPFLGTSISVPDMSKHNTLWKMFDRNMSFSGINKAPVEWD